ncbi:MAG: zinc-ribbon domain-containing protein [Candidatus Kariarchaeaceae archaeon]
MTSSKKNKASSFCSSCGDEIEPGDQFCPGCGKER